MNVLVTLKFEGQPTKVLKTRSQDCLQTLFCQSWLNNQGVNHFTGVFGIYTRPQTFLIWIPTQATILTGESSNLTYGVKGKIKIWTCTFHIIERFNKINIIIYILKMQIHYSDTSVFTKIIYLYRKLYTKIERKMH